MYYRTLHWASSASSAFFSVTRLLMSRSASTHLYYILFAYQTSQEISKHLPICTKKIQCISWYHINLFFLFFLLIKAMKSSYRVFHSKCNSWSSYCLFNYASMHTKIRSSNHSSFYITAELSVQFDTYPYILCLLVFHFSLLNQTRPVLSKSFFIIHFIF